MNRNIAIAAILAAAAGAALADDITIDTTPFTSAATRAQVQAELAAFKQSGVNPWSNQYNQLAQFSSQRSRAAVTAEYTNARDQVAALTGEDSGSAYLAARHRDAGTSATVAGQPRNPQ
jgi:opacity protein-like surface antigen